MRLLDEKYDNAILNEQFKDHKRSLDYVMVIGPKIGVLMKSDNSNPVVVVFSIFERVAQKPNDT